MSRDKTDIVYRFETELAYDEKAQQKTDLLNPLEAAFDEMPDEDFPSFCKLQECCQVGDKIKVTMVLHRPKRSS